MPKKNPDQQQRASKPRQETRRVDVEMPVRISTIDPDYEPETGQPYFRTSTETSANVSSGGAFVQTGEAIEPGRRLLIELDLPDGPSFQTIGKVVWRKSTVQSSNELPGTGIGIEFVGGAPAQLRALEGFLSQRQRAQEAGPEEPKAGTPAPKKRQRRRRGRAKGKAWPAHEGPT